MEINKLKMYQLLNETDNKRTYSNASTGTEVETFLLYTTADNAKWWAFADLLSIPFIRKAAADRITQLYGAGLTKDDIDKFISSQKALLKSNDAEKYEKAYAAVLELENISATTADPVKQLMSLSAVYILSDNERIDTFSMAEAGKKMEQWTFFPDAQAFFLSWLTDGISSSTKHFSNLSQIASMAK